MTLLRRLSPLGSVTSEELSRIYDNTADFLEDKENRQIKNYSRFGITFTTELDVSSIMYGSGKCRYLTLPDKPTFLQKLIAFFCNQLMVVKLVRKESMYIGYAYSWLNAKEIFNW